MKLASTNQAIILTMAVFFLQPLTMGAWFALIPTVKAALGLSKAELAFALLGSPAAILVSLQVAGRVVSKFGPRRLMMVGLPLQCLAALLLLFAPNGVFLFFALVLFGAAVGFMEMAINVYSGRLEKASGALIMNRCHGFWSLGLMAGAGVMTLLANHGSLSVLAALAAFSALLGIGASYLLPRIGEDENARALPRRRFKALPKALIMIALFMLATTLVEGAMVDWAAVYLAERLGGADAGAGIAVSVFSGFVAAGRFGGDWFKAKVGAVIMARVMMMAAIAGLTILIVPLPIQFAFLGFALVGFGISTAFPLGVSATAALDDQYEANNIAIMSTVALSGFLIGPPIIGIVAEATSLPTAFAMLLPGLILAIWLSGWLGGATRDDSSGESRV